MSPGEEDQIAQRALAAGPVDADPVNDYHPGDNLSNDALELTNDLSSGDGGDEGEDGDGEDGEGEGDEGEGDEAEDNKGKDNEVRKNQKVSRTQEGAQTVREISPT